MLCRTHIRFTRTVSLVLLAHTLHPGGVRAYGPNSAQRLEHTFRAEHRLFQFGHPLDAIRRVSQSVADALSQGALSIKQGRRVFEGTLSTNGVPVHVQGTLNGGKATMTNMWALTGR